MLFYACLHEGLYSQAANYELLLNLAEIGKKNHHLHQDCTKTPEVDTDSFGVGSSSNWQLAKKEGTFQERS